LQKHFGAKDKCLVKEIFIDITLKISHCLPFILGLAIRKHEQDWPFSLSWLVGP